MASDDTERDRALRAMLVDRVTAPAPARGMRLQPERLRVGLVTAVVLVAIVAVSVLAVRFGSDRGAPADGGMPPTSASLPSMSIPAGVPLGHWTDADGTVQHHTIHPNGLALFMAFTCTGGGLHEEYMIHIPHDEDVGGACSGGSGGGGNKGIPGSVTLSISTTKDMRWSLTVVGIPETYVTPRPVPTPTDSTGTAVRYCTATDLAARFVERDQPAILVVGGELVFTNTGPSTCALAGYPEVRFLDHGVALGHNTMNHTDARSDIAKGLSAVILRPGGHAYSQVDFVPPGENAKQEGPCVARPVTSVRVDLQYDLAEPQQTGSLTVPIGKKTACLNGAHGALGKYGQISSTVFVDYSTTGAH